MSNKLLVESDPHQTRVAVLENGRVVEVFVERKRRRDLVGNVYRGRTSRVLPGMQAAFVDVGLERDAFLYVNDIRDRLADLEDLDAADAELGTCARGERRAIADLVQPGQELIVQVRQDPMPNKGARITTQIALPGRYVVLLPTVDDFGISRRIDDPAERERLRALLEELGPVPGGLIVRTAGEGKGAEELRADLSYLSRLWTRICSTAESVSAPALLHRDLDVALRVVRDLFNSSFEEIWVDGEEERRAIEELVREFEPEQLDRVRSAEERGTLFERFGVEREIEAALRSRVWLDSGGYLVINQTEALVAIDVNTGRYVGRKTLEDTVVRTNLEAVEEIVRQIRLRDLGGIIVVDFIDMTEAEHREKVFAALERELKKDRARSQVLEISEFGLVEITRKRTRANLERVLTRACPYCRGRGRVEAPATVALKLRRRVLRDRGRLRGKPLVVRLHPEVAAWLRSEESEVLQELEAALKTSVGLREDPALHREEFEIVEAADAD